MRTGIKLIVLFILFALVSIAVASESVRGISTSGAVNSGRRVALVIGNADYGKGRLKNPVNDAEDLAALLKKLGFEVTLAKNLDNTGMKMAIDRFGKRLRNSSVGLFYYAGHGAGVGGENYLIPIGAEIPNEEVVEYQAVKAGRVLAWMRAAQNSMNIMILDACRDNPYAAGFRSGSGGLNSVRRMPQGTIVAFAAAPGEKALDGTGRNSPFTSALIKYMAQPGVPAKRALEKVQVEVYESTGKRQSPWLQNSPLRGEFYFHPGDVGEQKQEPVKVADSPSPALGEVDQRKLKIQRLLKQADADLAANRLTTPPGNNALEKYQEVLRLNPMTSEANEGLKRIVGRYVDLAEGRIKAGDWDAAERFLERASKVSEGDSRVLALRDQLREARQAGREESSTRPSSSRPASQPSQASPGGKRFTNSLGMEFVLVPAGSFDMGSNSGRSDEKPVHRVSITKPFYLQTTEVTQGQWRSVMGSNRSHFKSCGDNCPVEPVSWNDAQEFIRRLNQREGGKKYRLPTEAEWEYAARAGGTGAYCFGDDPSYLGGYGWYDKNSGNKTHRVGQKKANAWGLYDMHGNVWEWCEDWYQKNYYSSFPGADPSCINSTSGYRVMRGGSWHNDAMALRSAIRNGYNPGGRFNTMGFRVAKDY